jgi:hypothetical protein
MVVVEPATPRSCTGEPEVVSSPPPAEERSIYTLVRQKCTQLLMYEVPFRRAVLLAYNNIRSLRKTARIFDISVNTIQRWRQSIQPNKWPSKHASSVIDFVVSYIKSEPFASCQSVREKVFHIFKYNVSRQFVLSVFQKHSLTFKRARHCVDPTSDTIRTIPTFTAAFKNNRPHLICVDETNISEKTLARYGWCQKGIRLKTTKASKSWTSRTIITACSEDMHVSRVLKSSCNAVHFADFISSLPFRDGSVILMDNVAFHKSRIVQDALLRKGYTPLFTPPYTPDANHVENVFSQLKSIFRSLRCREHLPFDTALEITLKRRLSPSSLSLMYDRSYECVLDLCNKPCVDGSSDQVCSHAPSEGTDQQSNTHRTTTECPL